MGGVDAESFSGVSRRLVGWLLRGRFWLRFGGDTAGLALWGPACQGIGASIA